MPLKSLAAAPGVPVEIEASAALLAALVKVAAAPGLTDEDRFEIAVVRFIAARALHRARPSSNGSRSDLFAP
jgi:hypothetical protein